MNTELSLKEILAQLANEGLTKPIEGGTLSLPTETAETRGSSLPWFVKLFIGISAWTAAILITAFLFTINLIDEDQALFWGLAFCALAIGLNRIGRGNIFWGQLSLAMNLTGQVLAIVGIFSLFDYNDLLPMTIFVTILEAFLIWLHRDAVLRFISTLVVGSFVLALIFDQNTYTSLHVFIFILAATSIYLHLMENRLKLNTLGDMLTPVNSAITFFYLGVLTLPLTDEFELDWRITAISLFPLLLFLLTRIVSDLGYSLHNRVVITLTIGCALLLIPSLRMPGILAAITILILGFWRNNRGLMGLASIFLVFYIWAYYYSLEWTLLSKSLVLLTSGIILLTLRYFVVRFITKAGGEV